MSQDTISPHELERLQVRAIAFHDRADELVAALHSNDEGEQSARDDWSQLSNTETASQALAEILALEARRPEIPEWFGPVEQLHLQVSYSAERLIEEAERICSELEAHNGHIHPCRCDELFDFLTERLNPAFAEWEALSKAIKQLRRP